MKELRFTIYPHLISPACSPRLPPAKMSSSTKIINPIDPEFHGYLDPDFIAYYNTHIGIKASTHDIPFAELRANPQKYKGGWCRDYSSSPFVKTLGLSALDGTIYKARVYSPDPDVWGKGPYGGVHVNFHGKRSLLRRGSLCIESRC
jgi:hypothetical protein